MKALRNCTRRSIVWGLIPVAIFAGLPSTACQCADGRIKLVCTHLYQRAIVSEQDACQFAVDEHGCCHSSASCSGEEPATCCANSAAGDCCDGCAAPGLNGRHSCCTPVFTAPSAKPAVVAAPALERHLGLLPPLPAFRLQRLNAFVHFQRHAHDTGPPVDLVITLCCLLI